MSPTPIRSFCAALCGAAAPERPALGAHCGPWNQGKAVAWAGTLASNGASLRWVDLCLSAFTSSARLQSCCAIDIAFAWRHGGACHVRAVVRACSA